VADRSTATSRGAQLQRQYPLFEVMFVITVSMPALELF